MPTAESYCCFCGKLARAHQLKWEYEDGRGRPLRLIWHEACALKDPLHEELATADAQEERLRRRGDDDGAAQWAYACGLVAGRIIERAEAMPAEQAAVVLQSIAKRRSTWTRALWSARCAAQAVRAIRSIEPHRQTSRSTTDEQREVLRLLERGAGR